MVEQSLQWQVQPIVEPPEWFVQAIRHHAPDVPGQAAAQLLWRRGIQDAEQLAGFLKPELYRPASPFEFGQEMDWAVARLQQARDRQEPVAIWGDFDADGITATAVLWDGLGQFFQQGQQLHYYIPNRLKESHGLSRSEIDTLAKQGCSLIVTCDTGSTNLAEIDYAHGLGMDVIVTDHHTLPEQRPPVTAIINPRSLPIEHPLAHLSGVAVAYKLVEALYQVLPEVPQRPLSDLLDLVAIGLIADLVQLTGDCRYLAQQGIDQLQKDTQRPAVEQHRPGIVRLLEFCKKTGDRPTDISFGIGPRINAVSRIQGDARFCVELLTSQDEPRCRQLATETELANARRKALQKDVTQQVKDKLAQLDLSTTCVIVLSEVQWPVGILGLVAGQIAQEYGRPTILLSVDAPSPDPSSASSALARGSARSLHQIDLYQLVKDQAPLLSSFGGHPFAAGLSLPVANIPLFTEAINQQLRQQSLDTAPLAPTIYADLVVTVADLGRDLFRELKLLEPCGMGNPVPKLLIQNCWFEKVRNQNLRDLRGQKLRYIKTQFEIWDDSISHSGSAAMGFPGIWWEHYREDLPQGRCDAIAELDYNAFQKRYEIRLLAVRPAAATVQLNATPQIDWILDYRQPELESHQSTLALDESVLPITQCPLSWHELHSWFRKAQEEHQKLAIAYPPPQLNSPQQIWQQLLGIAKYLSRTGEIASRPQLQTKLGIGDRSLTAGLQALERLGCDVICLNDQELQLSWNPSETPEVNETEIARWIDQFFAAVREEQFCQQYFYQVPLSTIQAVAYQSSLVNR